MAFHKSCTCDRLTTYRQICAQVGREYGLIPCFMSKPFMGLSANGCHHNLSLWYGGEDKLYLPKLDPLPGNEGVFSYRSGGKNAFLPDVQLSETKPGPIGLQAIAGILEHFEALSAIGFC
ncbi:MAG: hypothetical protein ACFBSE_24995 [Prochloraceae cyanobacterium]